MTENVKWTGVWYYCDTGAIENLGKELEKAEAHIARLEAALREIVRADPCNEQSSHGRFQDPGCPACIARAALAGGEKCPPP